MVEISSSMQPPVTNRTELCLTLLITKKNLSKLFLIECYNFTSRYHWAFWIHYTHEVIYDMQQAKKYLSIKLNVRQQYSR